MSDPLNSGRFKYVPEVVEESAIKFWKVPRLGAFMAIPLVYKSCLLEGSLDKAIVDWSETQAEIVRLEEERENAEPAEGEPPKENEEGEDGEEQEKEPIHLDVPEFDTEEKKFVVCIDTLGQDRELTDD